VKILRDISSGQYVTDFDVSLRGPMGDPPRPGPHPHLEIGICKYRKYALQMEDETADLVAQAFNALSRDETKARAPVLEAVKVPDIKYRELS
jgi:hypothetical protein